MDQSERGKTPVSAPGAKDSPPPVATTHPGLSSKFGVRWIFYTVVGVLTVLVPATVDLFGFRTASDATSERLLQLVAAPFYPQPGLRIGDQYREPLPITVILLDSAFLQSTGYSWPLSYAQHAHLIRRIARFEPKAIFLDLYFTQKRGTERERDLFVNELRGLTDPRNDGPRIPVFVAAPNPCSTDALGAHLVSAVQPGRGLLRSVIDVATPVIAGWSGYGQDYPVVVAVENLRHAEGRAGICAPRQGEENRMWLSAAGALYREYCAERDSARKDSCADLDATPELFVDPLVILWGAEVRAEMTRFHSVAECPLVAPRDRDRVFWILGALLKTMGDTLFSTGDQAFQPCPYTETLPGSALYPYPEGENIRVGLSGGASDERDRRQIPRDVFVRDEVHEKDVASFIKDRFVLVGTSQVGIPEVVTSPVHGDIPGVYAHAMALDNLFRFGKHYVRNPGLFSSPLGFWKFLIESGLMLVAIVWVAGLRAASSPLGASSRISSASTLVHWFVRAAIIGALLGGVMLGIAVALTVQYRTSPINWLGLFAGIGVSGLVMQLARPRERTDGAAPEAVETGPETGEGEEA